MGKVTYYLQIDNNNDIILTKARNDRTYNPKAKFSWDDASKLDFQAPANTELTFKFGASMANWTFRNGPNQKSGYPIEKGIHFAKGVKKGNPRNRDQGSFQFVSQTPDELVIVFDDSDVNEPKGKNPEGYLKYEMYLSNKQTNNKGEVVEVFYTIDPGGGKGGSQP